MARNAAILVAALLVLLSACATAPGPAPRPLVILVSIDGFRADYLQRGVTPALSRLAQEGASGAMRPSFPSNTFPNHYTLVTGLRPDRHGVVDNTMIDAAIPGVTFSMANKAAVTDARWWDGATPVWVSAERAGLSAATLFWPGSEAAIGGVRPGRWLPYDQTLPAPARVDRVLAWLDEPDPPAFVTLYFDAVDTAGHRGGPDSEMLTASLIEADAAIARLRAGLEQRGLWSRTNLVVVADHGMAALSPERVLILEDLVPAAAGRARTWGSFVTIDPVAGHEADLDRALLRPHEHLQCWRKGEAPRRFHYGAHRRVTAIVCLAETGWTVEPRVSAKTPRGGAHGFDPAAPEMAALFLAHGPAFRAGARPPVFDNVDVYPLLMRLLGLRAEPNDGDLDALRPALSR